MKTTVQQVRQYAATIYEPGDVVELRAIDKQGWVRKFWRTAKDLLGLVPELETLNRQGYNIYIGPNARRAEGLSGDVNVAICRCLFCDFDGVEPGDGCGVWTFIEPIIEAAGLPLPDLTVFSGHGVHCYWRLLEPLAPERWQIVQKRLIAALQSDSACGNPERLLRLPGFLNHKFDTPADAFVLFNQKATTCQ